MSVSVNSLMGYGVWQTFEARTGWIKALLTSEGQEHPCLEDLKTPVEKWKWSHVKHAITTSRDWLCREDMMELQKLCLHSKESSYNQIRPLKQTEQPNHEGTYCWLGRLLSCHSYCTCKKGIGAGGSSDEKLWSYERVLYQLKILRVGWWSKHRGEPILNAMSLTFSKFRWRRHKPLTQLQAFQMEVHIWLPLGAHTNPGRWECLL